MEGDGSLELLSEKTLPQAANSQLLAYCSSMDLVALGSTDQQVLIYRLNGQRVYGASQKAGTMRVEAIRWKSNGQLLAIAWSDGSVRLVGAESGKIVHQFSTGPSISGVSCMGWASNFASKKPGSVRRHKSPQTWQDIFSEEGHLSKGRAVLDLPRDLALIDIETSLPKLSILASGGGSEEVFTSRPSLDAIFRPFDPKDDNVVDVMVVGTKEGNIHLSIYDSFVIGLFKFPVVIGGLVSHLTLHASHPQYSTHSLLMKPSGSESSLYFVPMDLRFVSASSHYLSLLASRSTALQNLLRYIHQVQILMISEWKGTQELPGKFLRNINETLRENSNCNIVQALYHSVATGHTFPTVREWLVDELTERGHKRWDKAVVSGLENLKRLVHENMLPALDRCSVILSRLKGIAKFQGANDTTGFSSHQISMIMDTVACLHLVSSRVLIQVVDELNYFAAFSSWLRYEIDRLASDPSTSPTEESIDKESGIDHGKVLLYLETTMTDSPLTVFLGDSTSEQYTDWSHADHGVPMFDLLGKQLEKQAQGLPYMTPMPRVEALCNYLVRQADKVFGQIAEAEKRNVLFGKAHELGIAHNGGPMDMRISEIEYSFCYSFVAMMPQDSRNQIQLFRIALSIENGISNVRSVDSHILRLGNGRIKDFKFVDGHSLLALWESSGTRTTSLLSIPYQGLGSDINGKYQVRYATHDSKANVLDNTAIDDEEVLGQFSKYIIPSEGLFVPETMQIREGNGGKSNEEYKRIIILGHDKLHYKVFRFPEPNNTNEEVDGDTSMS